MKTEIYKEGFIEKLKRELRDRGCEAQKDEFGEFGELSEGYRQAMSDALKEIDKLSKEYKIKNEN